MQVFLLLEEAWFLRRMAHAAGVDKENRDARLRLYGLDATESMPSTRMCLNRWFLRVLRSSFEVGRRRFAFVHVFRIHSLNPPRMFIYAPYNGLIYVVAHHTR